MPNHLLDGGVTGVSIIVAKLLGVPLGVLLMLLNIPFVYLGYRKFGKQFAAYSAIGIVTLALLTMVHLPRRRSKEPLTQWIIRHSLSYLMPTK